jgi:hypothetical protein
MFYFIASGLTDGLLLIMYILAKDNYYFHHRTESLSANNSLFNLTKTGPDFLHPAYSACSNFLILFQNVLSYIVSSRVILECLGVCGILQ